MKAQKSVRIMKKIRTAPGIWRFVSLNRAGQRYVWDPRPGQYFLEWWEGPKRRREAAGSAPSEALEAQRRKVHGLIGKMVAGKALSQFRQTTPLRSCQSSKLPRLSCSMCRCTRRTSRGRWHAIARCWIPSA